MKREPDDVLDELLIFETGVFPDETLAEIIERREEFLDPLLGALDDMSKNR